MGNSIEENNNKETIDQPSQYFSVSVPKLIAMSVCTMGLYELYWFYKNWMHIKQKNNSEIMPFWRAFFAPLWAYSAFKSIRQELNTQNISLSLQAGFLAVVYFFLESLWRLPDPYWLLSFLSFIPLLPANSATTKINEKMMVGFQQNKNIKGWNWLAIILGGLFFVLSLVGTFMQKQA